MKHNNEVWSLWDADELVSVHLTDHDARDAREQHLERYLAFPADRDVVMTAVEIRRTRLVDHTPLVGSNGRRPQASNGGP
ncbi:hypothetical protein ASG90_19375 [Nocardioides sp. Soil797]|nr:hypothetical protein ASG90_19375 [Nocardioides sp. Soil797]